MTKLSEIRSQAARKMETADQTIARADGVLSLARNQNDTAAVEIASKARSKALESKGRYQHILSRAEVSLDNTRRLSGLLSSNPEVSRGAGMVFSAGEVRIRRGSEGEGSESGADDRVLMPGDGIRTGPGGSAELRLMEDGSRIEMGPETNLEIENEETVSLVYGKVLMEIRKLVEGRMKRFEVRTPAAVCAVRGTRFAVFSDPGGTVTLSVLEGEVAFSGPGGEGGVIVTSNRQSVLVPGELPSSPREIKPDAVFAEFDPQ